jgi:transcriptional regulator with XRE-family HTH domain
MRIPRQTRQKRLHTRVGRLRTEGNVSDWIEARRRSGRRPITADEVPYLEAVGAELRRLRELARMSRRMLASASLVSASHLVAIEHGTRRTRRSTLCAITLALADGDEATAEANTAKLVALAGPTLAPSNRFSDRREANRPRRQARIDRLAATALPVAEKLAERLVAEMLVGYRLVPLPKRDRTRHWAGMEIREPAAVARAKARARRKR